MTIEEEIAAARELVARSDPSTTGLWPRAASLLARHALERALDAFWTRRSPGVQLASTRAQLACLPDFLHDAQLAGEISFTWGALSRACHHHVYELGMTEPELRRHLAAVARVAARLASR